MFTIAIFLRDPLPRSNSSETMPDLRTGAKRFLVAGGKPDHDQ